MQEDNLSVLKPCKTDEAGRQCINTEYNNLCYSTRLCGCFKATLFLCYRGARHTKQADRTYKQDNLCYSRARQTKQTDRTYKQDNLCYSRAKQTKLADRTYKQDNLLQQCKRDELGRQDINSRTILQQCKTETTGRQKVQQSVLLSYSSARRMKQADRTHSRTICTTTVQDRQSRLTGHKQLDNLCYNSARQTKQADRI